MMVSASFVSFRSARRTKNVTLISTAAVLALCITHPTRACFASVVAVDPPGATPAVPEASNSLPTPAPPADTRSPFGIVIPSPSEAAAQSESLQSQRENLFAEMETRLGLSMEQLARVRQVFEHSSILGQGNPSVSAHPVGRAECRAAISERPLRPGDAVCGAPYMSALSAGADAQADAATACIDQFEFPGIPCEFPVVHVSAREAAQLCEAVDKRLCDAHEWEGACAGAINPPELEYAWGQDRASMRRLHNLTRSRIWAYGPVKNHAICATNSYKTPGCPGGGFASCGSNTYPTGSFPDCVSPLGVYDLHGNAAEHMNLATRSSELTSAGGYGVTEMKGSWFIFSHYEAHEDDCHWRAPDWHASRVTDERSHGNYHLGFRCCKNIPDAEPSALGAPASTGALATSEPSR
jgi:sulfatase-modifying factor enzyme 1